MDSRKRQNSKLSIRYSGFSLVEMIIYLALLTVLLIAVINSLSYMMKNYRELKAAKSIAISANEVLSRFSYEVKKANNLSGSFGTSSGTLTLTTGTSTTVFSLNASRIKITVNGISDYLTSTDTSVSSLYFYKLNATTTSLGAVIEFTIKSAINNRTEFFEDTVMIRNVK